MFIHLQHFPLVPIVPANTIVSVHCHGRGFYLNNDGTKVNLSQKPLLQLEFLLRACHQGNWVVDMCCGSGSGLIAALRMGYSVAGFDTNKTQVEAARRRVASFAQQEVNLRALDRAYCIARSTLLCLVFHAVTDFAKCALVLVVRPVDSAVAVSDFTNYALFLLARSVDQAV